MAANERNGQLGDPISEGGRQQEAENQDQNQTTSIILTEHEKWKTLFELQHRNMMELIRLVKEPKEKHTKMTLPEFNPDNLEADAQAWCNTVDLCMKENILSGSQLIISLSQALKGSAATWLTQNTYPEITWPQLKDLFLARFDTVETPAATVHKILGGTPNDGENISSYVSRILSTLVNRWRNMTVEQIAIGVALAHVARTDPQIRRIAYTTEINSRIKLQQELMPFLFNKRSAPSSEEPYQASEAKRPRWEPTRKCYNCGRTGHLAYDCRSDNSKDNNGNNAQHSESTSTNNTASRRESVMHKKIICFRCGGPGHTAPRCSKAETRHEKSADQVERRVNICATVPTTGHLENLGEKFSFCFDSGAECSLIKENIAKRFPGKRLCNSVTLLGIGKARLQCNFQILSIVVIQGHSVQLLFHVVPDNSLTNDILIGRDLIALGFSVEISQYSLAINKNQVVAHCEVGQKIDHFNEINTDILIESRATLLELLEEYRDYFVRGIPTSRVISGQLEIKLVDPSRTVQRRPYRMSPDEREIVRNKIKELITVGIVRESCSPFASPILLVKKKDGTDRLCIDYRELNSNTIPDRYPLPLISDQIQRLAGANYFTSLDMASGYHQIPIHSDSIERTAFVTPDGQYEYITMPFGLRNAPSVYQRAINKALGNLAETFAICYIDDIIIPSRTIEEGIHRLRLVLKALTTSGFSFNLKKCAFLKTQVEYLGYQVSSGQIKPNPRKINALTQLLPPQTITQLKQFIGLASYFRQFIPGFSQITAPLYKLTAGKGNLNWTPELESIRQKITTILTHKPILTIFDPQFPIELHTDASAEGYGAILIQKINNKQHVIEYFSRRTSRCESKYHSYELETLAVVNAIKHFRHYLQNQKFLVVTDCNAVKASKTKRDLTPRVHRWWCFLQAFEFDIEYRQGKRMEHVDFLSRNPLPLTTSENKISQKRVDLTEITKKLATGGTTKRPRINSHNFQIKRQHAQ